MPSDAAPDAVDEAWEAPARPDPPTSNGHPTSIAYRICRPDGELVAIHGRVETPEGKRMFWHRPDGTKGLGGIPLADLPLYGAERVGSWDLDRPVLVTEGEKAAQALIDAGWQAVGTVTGASSTPGPEALSILTGCQVVLWPDNDKIGAEHMSRVAEGLHDVAATLHTIVWTDAPPHGDAADYLSSPMVDVTIEELIAGARREAEELRPGATGMDAADLLALDLPPLRWVVPGLLPEGTTILAAPPKIGKSCLVYQVAVEASIGGELFGRRVEPGSVLYLALEDGQRRGQDRLRTALAGRTMPRGRLEVRWTSAKVGQGLEEELTAWLDDHPDAVMVAVDTLGKVRAPSSGRRNAYEVDVEDLGRLQSIFRDRPVALVIVHHAAKAKHDDFLASVSGTYGITGSADTTLFVRRKREEHFGTITVTGRDVPDATQSVRFDGKLWTEAPTALSEATFERSEVYQVIAAQGPMFPKAIADQLGKTRQAVAYLVEQLVTEGAVVRVTKGYAAAAPDDIDDAHSRARARGSVPPVSAVSQREREEREDTRAGAHVRDPIAERYQASFDSDDGPWS